MWWSRLAFMVANTGHFPMFIFKKWHVLLSASLAVRSLYILVSPFSLFSCLLFDSKKAEDTLGTSRLISSRIGLIQSPTELISNYRIKLDKTFLFNLKNEIPSCFTLWYRRSLTGGSELQCSRDYHWQECIVRGGCPNEQQVGIGECWLSIIKCSPWASWGQVRQLWFLFSCDGNCIFGGFCEALIMQVYLVKNSR